MITFVPKLYLFFVAVGSTCLFVSFFFLSWAYNQTQSILLYLVGKVEWHKILSLINFIMHLTFQIFFLFQGRVKSISASLIL
jgi:hypothetical protein